MADFTMAIASRMIQPTTRWDTALNHDARLAGNWSIRAMIMPTPTGHSNG